jgi:hypothetical protein
VPKIALKGPLPLPVEGLYHKGGYGALFSSGAKADTLWNNLGGLITGLRWQSERGLTPLFEIETVGGDQVGAVGNDRIDVADQAQPLVKIRDLDAHALADQLQDIDQLERDLRLVGNQLAVIIWNTAYGKRRYSVIAGMK